ncbi:uncharacterized protein LOC144116273 [Amblyomma americanum]
MYIQHKWSGSLKNSLKSKNFKQEFSGCGWCDWLRLVCFTWKGTGSAGMRTFKDYQNLAETTTEFLWNKRRQSLPKAPMKQTGEVPVIYLGGATVSSDTERVLRKGPKFSLEVPLSKPELLASVHRIADKVEGEEKGCCLSEGVDSVSNTSQKKDCTSLLRRVAGSICDSWLRVLLSDKEGGFVVLPRKLFGEKALTAINKNFRVADVKPTKAKAKAVALLDDLKLERMKNEVMNNKVHVLTVFFSAKSHKLECPFRAIVTERRTWQAVVSRYLQRHLKSLSPEDPYKTTSSDGIVKIFKESMPGVNYGFSVDIEELFYSVPHNELLMAVSNCIERLGVVGFQNACGISIEGFMELLNVYLSSTLVSFQDKFYVQKRGICIGSSVAPVLTEIYLVEVDCSLSRALTDDRIARVFRYVDDFLILLKMNPNDNPQEVTNEVLTSFKSKAPSLNFTEELPENSCLQFLD